MHAALDAALREVSLTDDSLRARFNFPPTLPMFAGHFPGHPLVPGVVEVALARFALERARDARYRLVEVTQAKFTAPLGPDEDILLEGTLRAEGSRLKLSAHLTRGGDPAASLRLVLEPA